MSKTRFTILSSALEQFDDVVDRLDDVLDVLATQSRIERQRYDAFVFTERHREAVWLKPVLVTVVGVQMDRYEMDTRADVSRPELFDEAGAVNRESLEVKSKHEQMPGVLHARLLGRNLDFFQATERLTVAPHDLPAACVKARKLLELMETDRGLKVARVVLEARANNLVIPGTLRPIPFPRIAAHPMQAPDTAFGHQVRRPRQHPTLGGG